MCYDLDARPPLPPISGAAGDGGPLTLTSADGTQFAAFSARAAAPGGPGIVVLPDVRGLHPFFEELALRFAEAGVHATAIDYFARTAETPDRGEGFDYQAHVAQTRTDTLYADVAAAAAHLRSPEGGRAERLYSVGFCFGGRLSLLQATTGLVLAGVIGFYGWPVGPHRTGLPAPADLAANFACPVLTFWGGADQGIGSELVEAFSSALADAGVAHRSIVYPDAPHSFFDRRATEFASASEDAWRQMLDFVRA
ncbi:MAG TPA: dienelactone hydrolase family protein [Candidatus Limnocylindria bacterium]